MRIDDQYFIEKQGSNFTLVRIEKKHRTADHHDGLWKKGDEYDSRQEFYYGSVKQALIGYLSKIPDESITVSEIVKDINKAEERIKQFIKYNGC